MKFVQTPTCTLYASISASAVSLRVSPYPKDLAGNKLAIGDFGSAPCITIDPKVRGIEEIISFATMTDNGDNTCTLSGLTRGLSSKSPYTASGTSTPHSASALVVFSNNPQMYDNLVDKDSAQTVTAVKTFTASPIVPTPTTDFQTATKAYADGLTYSGAPNADTTTKGIVEEATQTEVDARTTTGGTGAKLFPPLDKLRSTQLSDYVATDTGAADAYAIAPTPAITEYVAGQRFTFKVAHTNTTTSTLAVSGLASPKAIKKLGGTTALVAGDLVAGQVVEVEYDGTNFQLLTPVATAPLTSAEFTSSLKFGGDGSDGALAVSSGNTNIDCAGAAIVVKNYSSVSITGTGSITFINPAASGTLVVIRSTGDVTLTSSATPMIDASGCGAAGGAAITHGTNTPFDGNIGTGGSPFFLFATKAGGGGTMAVPTGGVGGAVPTTITPSTFFSSLTSAILKYGAQLWVGAGGGGAGAYSSLHNGTSGAGGRGGGGLIIECRGSLNFTTASGISVAGKNGTNPTDTTYGGGGGGGAGGFCYILYNTLTSASGTITVSGGIGGTNGSASSAPGGGGGGNAYTAGSNGNTAAGTNTGAGAVGVSLAAKNVEYL